MKNKLLLVLLLTAAQTLGAFAQNGEQIIVGTDAYEHQKEADNRDCYVYNRYVVKTVSSEGNGVYVDVCEKSAGNLTARACEVGRARPFMSVKDSDSQFFSGLVGSALIIDDGTGPDSRELRIIDLRTKKNIHKMTVHEIGKVSGGRFLNFTEFSKTKRPIRECPQAKNWSRDGFSVGWIQQSRLDLRTMKKTSAGKITCTALQ